MASKPKLVLYLDIVSPFAYLAYYVVRHSPVFANCDVTYVPIFLGGIMKACGNTPPIYIKSLILPLPSIALTNSIFPRQRVLQSIRAPPMGSNVQRALTAVDIMFPELLPETVDLLYQASFADHMAVHEEECLIALLQKIFGAEKTEHILQRSRSDDVKKLLAKRTEEVVEKGSFGLPWYIGGLLG
ncbi:MAG: hypothetical protein Q9193_002118 [Seirophora villosa]